MAITPMSKVMIVCHRTQVSDLLEAMQEAGICQILNADEAMVSRDTPGLAATRERPKDLEELVGRLDRGITFLKEYTAPKKGLANMLAPRPLIERKSYHDIVSDADALKVADQAEQLQAAMEKTRAEIDHDQSVLDLLRPWTVLETPIEELGRLQSSVCWPGLVPQQHFEDCEQQLAGLGAGVQRVSTYGTREACIVITLREHAEQVQKLLRSFEFEVVNFESMTGTVAERIREYEKKLADSRGRLEEHRRAAAALAENLLKLEILHDHYRNLLGREQARDSVPATEQAMILEGWCRRHDYASLEKLVARFDAANIVKIEAAPDEEPPVEIENTSRSQPFETITRLYGMPHPTDVDPTPYLAPFFAVFFGLCLTDAGYGLIMIASMWWLLKKIKGDAKFVKMMEGFKKDVNAPEYNGR